MYQTYFVLQEFSGTVYDDLRKRVQYERILGSTVLIQLMWNERSLPKSKCPLYTLAMEDVVVTFSGFQDKKDEMDKLLNMLLMMGGCVRTKIDDTVTHLIATCCHGEEYRQAQKANLPIMKGEWIEAWWKLKDLISWSTTFSDHMIATHKLKSFYGAKIYFFGFNEEDEKYLYNVLEKHGGERARIDDENCTHMVVAYNVNLLPRLKSKSAFIVKKNWFWQSIESKARLDENEYLYERFDSSRNERKLSMNVKKFNILRREETLPLKPATEDIKKKLEKRRHVLLELVDLETKYVGVLDTIMTQFKVPLETLVGKREKEILNMSEIKMIFGNFPPIHKVHKELLDELLNIDANNGDYLHIGTIFMKFESKFLKVYPPYINYFDVMKAVLEIRERDNRKFAAFLKQRQTLPDCGRHGLKELLMKPIHQLAGISLLLTRIFECTDRSNPDYCTLETGLFSIQHVLTSINEGKRNVDLYLTTLEMFNEIDKCPPGLLWSKRKFFSKNDVIEVTGDSNGRDERLTLFLFTDCIVMCKKNPSNRSKKPYEFIKLLNLKRIRKVAAVLKDNEGNKMFAFSLVGKPTDTEDQLLVFKFINDTPDNLHYLHRVCKLVAYVTHTPDPLTKFDVWHFFHIECKIRNNANKTINKSRRST